LKIRCNHSSNFIVLIFNFFLHYLFSFICKLLVISILLLSDASKLKLLFCAFIYSSCSSYSSYSSYSSDSSSDSSSTSDSRFITFL
jgi:hypothetical protein